MIGGLRRACGGAAADRFKTPLQCTQTLVDVTDFGGERAGVSGSLKHGCSRGARVAAPLVDALEPGVDLAFGFVLRHDPNSSLCSCCRSRWGKNPDVRTKVPTHNAAHVSESAAHRLGQKRRGRSRPNLSTTP